MRSFAAVVIMLFAALIITGCTQKEAKPVQESLPVPLKVGMSANYPPLTFEYKDKATGVEVDFANELGRALNRPVQFIILPRTQLFQALKTRSVDIVMSGTSITKDRKKLVLFSEPYMKISQMAIMRLGVDTPNPFSKGKGMKIGYSDFTTGAKFVKETFPMADQRGYTKIEHGVIGVMNGEVDYFFHDSPSVWYYTANNSIKDLIGWYVPYTDENLAWGFDRRNVAFKQEVDVILNQWKNNGTLQRIIRKWIPVTINIPQNSTHPMSFE